MCIKSMAVICTIMYQLNTNSVNYICNKMKKPYLVKK